MQCYIDNLFVQVLLMLNTCQSLLLGIDMTKINLGLVSLLPVLLFLQLLFIL